MEPIRKIIARLHGHFVEGKAVDLVMSERLLEVETVRSDGKKSNYYIPYVVHLLFLDAHVRRVTISLSSQPALHPLRMASLD